MMRRVIIGVALLSLAAAALATHPPRFRRWSVYLPRAGGFVDPSSGGLAWWLPMNTTNAVDPVLPDASVFGRDGIIHQATANEPTRIPAGDLTNTVYDFKGVDDYIEATNSATYLNGVTSLSASVWINPDIFGSNDGLIGSHNAGNTTGFGLLEGGGAAPANENIGFFVFGSGGVGSFQSSGNELVSNQWQLVVGTWRGSDGQMMAYHDGSNVISQASSSATGTLLQDTRITIGSEGAVAIGSRMFDGQMYSPKIYSNLVLTSAEVASLFTNTHPVTGTEVLP